MTVKRIAAAIFVKTPGVSPLKTRLAESIGTLAAEEFHHRATRCLQETLADAAHHYRSVGISFSPFWAIAEDSARDHPIWAGFPSISQGTGGLGVRMHSVYNRLLAQHDAVLLLGADSPQISPQLLTTAVESLDEHAFVLGPANDGGFYLLGGSHPIPREVWNRVPYSVSNTARVMEKELAVLGTVIRIEELVDVDVEKDLSQLLPKLESFSETSAQRQLASWIREKL